ncbi:VCBS repeat-containing protein, partial [bacterium]|nr:VCBS repeat-containing protein [bacterium]
CFQNFAQDVNGDGWADSIVVNRPGNECVWYENPQNKPGHWKEHVIHKSVNGETPLFVDLLGNGKKVIVAGIQPQGVMAWVEPDPDPLKPWIVHPISTPKNPSAARFAHGYGCGDLNGDGRKDVLCTRGWWEAPEDRTQSPWTFHPVNLGPACADMIVRDFDGDGDADVVTSSAHQYGVWWWEHVKTDKGITFKQHEFDKTYSQPHAVILADMNGDGTPDLMTGKRHYAHCGNDPGGKDPAMLYWYEVKNPAKGKVEFVRHDVDNNSGIGTQFEVADMNADGKLDIVISNKMGVFVFIQKQ